MFWCWRRSCGAILNNALYRLRRWPAALRAAMLLMDLNGTIASCVAWPYPHPDPHQPGVHSACFRGLRKNIESPGLDFVNFSLCQPGVHFVNWFLRHTECTLSKLERRVTRNEHVTNELSKEVGSNTVRLVPAKQGTLPRDLLEADEKTQRAIKAALGDNYNGTRPGRFHISGDS